MLKKDWTRRHLPLLCGAMVFQAAGGCSQEFIDSLAPTLVSLTLNVLLSSVFGGLPIGF